MSGGAVQLLGRGVAALISAQLLGGPAWHLGASCVVVTKKPRHPRG
jgi:hypothetical protein